GTRLVCCRRQRYRGTRVPCRWPIDRSRPYRGKNDRNPRMGPGKWNVATARTPRNGWRRCRRPVAGWPSRGAALLEADLGRASGGEVRVWDASLGKQLASLRTREPVASLAFASPDLVAVGTGQAEVGRIELHDLTTGKSRPALQGHGGPVMCLAFSADART